MERTFSIIKPDAVKRNLIGHINQIIEKNNLKIVSSKTHNLSKKEAEVFYGVHKDRPFFNVKEDHHTQIINHTHLSGKETISAYWFDGSRSSLIYKFSPNQNC